MILSLLGGGGAAAAGNDGYQLKCFERFFLMAELSYSGLTPFYCFFSSFYKLKNIFILVLWGVQGRLYGINFFFFEILLFF